MFINKDHRIWEYVFGSQNDYLVWYRGNAETIGDTFDEVISRLEAVDVFATGRFCFDQILGLEKGSLAN